MRNEPVNEKLEKLLGEIPYEEVPRGFSERVMASLEPRKVGLFEKIMLWLRTPMNVRITPIRAIPAMAAALLLLTLALPFGVREASQPHSGLVPVRFVLGNAGKAQHVAVIGSFNGWTPDGAQMKYDDTLGAWVAEMQLPPGVHEYVFLLDGKKVVADPGAPLSEDDGFGNRNSVLYLTEDNEQIL